MRVLRAINANKHVYVTLRFWMLLFQGKRMRFVQAIVCCVASALNTALRTLFRLALDASSCHAPRFKCAFLQRSFLDSALLSLNLQIKYNTSE